MPPIKIAVRPCMRLVFFLCLGLLSTFFAEVLSGSAPDFLITPFGYFGIYPIYALHSILVASLVIGRGKPYSLRTLYLSSLLFGMYEAYITKVLWSPPWSPDALSLAGIAIAETLILVLFWHAVMAFIIPLIWADSLLADSSELAGLFSERWRSRVFSPAGAAAIGIYGSLFIGSESQDAGEAFLLALFNCLVVTLAILLWKAISSVQKLSIEALLPRKPGLIILSLLLLANYIIFGFSLRPEIKPGILGHASVLVLYTLILLAIRRSMRLDASALENWGRDDRNQIRTFRLTDWAYFCAAFCLSTLLVNLLPVELESLLTGLGLAVGIFAGMAFLYLALLDLFKKNPVRV